MPIIGTKNLGLIKAIHVGVNPPLNTKILWYNDANTPYTTGPAKVHYYYDVILADWYPLIGAASSAGGYTYIAFATDCSGAGFTMNFDASIHCYWAVITSSVAIPNIQLRPELFTDLWTEFCRCDEKGKPQFVYLRFADDCECKNKIFTEPKYQVPCADCTWADAYQPQSTTPSFSMAFNGDGGIDITLTNAVAGEVYYIEPKVNSAPLTQLASYAVKVTAVLSAGEVLLDMGYSADTLTIVGGMTNNFSTHINSNPDNFLKLRVYATGAAKTISGVISIKLGTPGCVVNGGAELCWKCRKYWSIVVSDVELSEEQLANYICKKRLWLPISCDCGCGGTSGGTDDCRKQLEAQISSLYEIIAQLESKVSLQIEQLTFSYKELRNYVEKCCTSMTLQLQSLNEQNVKLNTIITQMQTYYDTKLLELENRLDQCCKASQPGVLDPVITQIATDVVVKYKTEQFDPAISALDNSTKQADAELGRQLTGLSIKTDEKDAAQDLILENHEARIIALETPPLT